MWLYTTDPVHLVGIAFCCGVLSTLVATAPGRRRD